VFGGVSPSINSGKILANCLLSWGDKGTFSIVSLGFLNLLIAAEILLASSGVNPILCRS